MEPMEFEHRSFSARPHELDFFVQPKRKMSLVSFVPLPSELILTIWSFFDVSTLLKVQAVSKEFHHYSSDNGVWFEMCKKYWFSGKDIPMKGIDWKAYFVEKYLMNQDKSIIMHKSINPEGILPRYRHTITSVPLPSQTGRAKKLGDADQGRVVILGGTGKARETTFGDIHYLDIEPTQKSPIWAPLTRLARSPLQGVDRDVTWTHSISHNNWKANLKLRNIKHVSGRPEEYATTRHTSCYIDGKIWIWGGSYEYPPKKVNDLFTYDVATNKMTKITNYYGTPPTARSDHCSTSVGKKIYIFGGSDPDVVPQSDLHVFDTESMTWQQLITRGPSPSARSGHVCAAIGTKIYIFGGAKWDAEGCRWKEKSNEIFVFDTETQEWSKPEIGGTAPPVSTFPAAFAFGRHFYVFGGGRVDATYVSDTWAALDTVTMTWTTPKLSGEIFNAKDCISACVVGHKVMLFGGYRGEPVNELQFIDMAWAKTMEKCGLEVFS